jgi:hypothetical protein
MKKLNLLYALLSIAFLISCKDDEDPTFKQEAFIGKWEETSNTSTDGTDDCEKTVVEFTATDIITTYTCDGTDGSTEVAYTFDNKRTVNFEVIGIESKMVILELNNTTLKVDVYLMDQKAGTATYKKI